VLSVDAIHTRYGDTPVLHGVSLEAAAGEGLCVLGRNGAGKTTTLRSIAGLTPPVRGRVRLRGRDVTAWRPHRLARDGLAYLPESRGIFASLSVEENLMLAAGLRAGPWSLSRVYQLFPRLAERRRQGGATLSGGEQQCLAIGRALLLNPEVLLLDEPTEGLAPSLVKTVGEVLALLRAQGTTVVLVEQNLRFATEACERAVVLGRGAVQWSGDSAAIAADEGLQRAWLGV
jgi:branched-chain amino acid transport system ATP-binding protein